MARANLASLLSNVDQTLTTQEAATSPTQAEPIVTTEASETPDPSAAQSADSVPSEGNVTEAVGNASARRATPSTREAATPALAPYLRFVRKETRLREDQQEALTRQARRLNRAKSVPGQRITDNTLIRVAVDLLLARVEVAAGDDEAAILESLK